VTDVLFRSVISFVSFLLFGRVEEVWRFSFVGWGWGFFGMGVVRGLWTVEDSADSGEIKFSGGCGCRSDFDVTTAIKLIRGSMRGIKVAPFLT
jgi:hypothetical protein